jgi:putative glycosyltransferase (TIGR04348 family)
LLFALHARRSFDSIKRFALRYPDRPLIVALTGTDLYRDIRSDANAQESMRLATRLVVLQDLGLRELPPGLRYKTRVVYQSAKPLARTPPLVRCFEVCVIGHLRDEKDPFRAALALRHVPSDSRIRVVHMGLALSDAMAVEAKQLMHDEPRYHWHGDLPHWKVRKFLSRSRLMVISSRLEGGANVVSEALMADVAVLASNIPGNIGLLGEDYAGYYKVEDERALAALMYRVETNSAFYAKLERQCRRRRKLITPEAEKASLEKLLREACSLVPTNARFALPTRILVGTKGV